MFKGYSTIAGFALIAALTVLHFLGVDVPHETLPIEDDRILLVLAIAFGVINRFRTNTAVFKDR